MFIYLPANKEKRRCYKQAFGYFNGLIRMSSQTGGVFFRSAENRACTRVG